MEVLRNVTGAGGGSAGNAMRGSEVVEDDEGDEVGETGWLIEVQVESVVDERAAGQSRQMQVWQALAEQKQQIN